MNTSSKPCSERLRENCIFCNDKVILDWDCCHTYRGYQQGINDTVDILLNFFPDEPCNYNGMDELSDCEYCEQHCGNHKVKECWENAVKNRWDLKIKENKNE